MAGTTDMNAVRRAAKARQNAAAKARSQNRERSQVFDMGEAMAECRARERRRQAYEEKLRLQEERRAQEASKMVELLRKQGGLKLTPNGGRDKWIADCFAIIKLLRTTTTCKFEYNRDWKEINQFVACVVR